MRIWVNSILTRARQTARAITDKRKNRYVMVVMTFIIPFWSCAEIFSSIRYKVSHSKPTKTLLFTNNKKWLCGRGFFCWHHQVRWIRDDELGEGYHQGMNVQFIKVAAFEFSFFSIHRRVSTLNLVMMKPIERWLHVAMRKHENDFFFRCSFLLAINCCRFTDLSSPILTHANHENMFRTGFAWSVAFMIIYAIWKVKVDKEAR